MTFVDADDWLPRDSINILYTKIKKANADLCCGNYYLVYALDKKAYRKYFDNEFSITNLDNLATFMETAFASWAKMFKASCIKSNFSVDLLVNEDTYFICNYLQNCDKIITTQNFVYYYNRVNANSLTHKYYPELNQYYVKPLRLRYQLFAGNLPVSEAEAIIELFMVALGHYITYLPHNEAIFKIRETHCIFEPYLQSFKLKSLGQSQSNYIQRYNLCYDDLQRKNYESIYKLLKVSKGKSKLKLIGFVKKSILFITDFIIFKLQLGYKK